MPERWEQRTSNTEHPTPNGYQLSTINCFGFRVTRHLSLVTRFVRFALVSAGNGSKLTAW